MSTPSFQPTEVLTEAYPRATQPRSTKMTLFPHQLTMLHRCLEIEESHEDAMGYGILADRPGSGKTFTILSLILEGKRAMGAGAGSPVNFIVVPQNIFEQWGDAVGRFTDELTVKKLSYHDMIDYETLFDIQIMINRRTGEKVIKSRKYYDIYLVPSTLYHPMVATIEANVLFDQGATFARMIFDEIDTIANLLVHTIPAHHTWFVSASFTPARLGAYQEYFEIDPQSGEEFDGTYVCKCEDEFVMKHMRVPDPIVFEMQCYNPILDRVISKLPYFSKEDMKALNAYDYSRLGFQFVKRVPNTEDQLMEYTSMEFEETWKDAIEKIKYYKENIDRMKAMEEQRYDYHDAVYDRVEEMIRVFQTMGGMMHSMKEVSLKESIEDLNEAMKDEPTTGTRPLNAQLEQHCRGGTYVSGLLHIMSTKGMDLQRGSTYFVERYVEYLLLVKNAYEAGAGASKTSYAVQYERKLKSFFQFMTMVEQDYTTLNGLIGKFRLIDTLFQQYNSIMEKDQMNQAEKETLMKIMKSFIEYYKKIHGVLQNAFFTFEANKDLLISLEEFTAVHRGNRRVAELHSAFEMMEKNNKHDFVNFMKTFLPGMVAYKEVLQRSIANYKTMVEYVENYDKLTLYVKEYMRFMHVEADYRAYMSEMEKLREVYVEQKKVIPKSEWVENKVKAILGGLNEVGEEGAGYEIETTKIDLIHEILKYYKEKESGARGIKMMIFSDFSSIFKKITPLCDTLDIQYVQLDGGNMRSIEMAVRQYKKEDAQILFCDSTLFGCGMNFENTSHVIFTHTPNPVTQTQIIGRAQRIGRTGILKVFQLHYPNEEMVTVTKKATDAHMFHFLTAMKDPEGRGGDALAEGDGNIVPPETDEIEYDESQECVVEH